MIELPTKLCLKNAKVKIFTLCYILICLVIVFKIYLNLRDGEGLSQIDLTACKHNNYCYTKDKNRNSHRYFAAKSQYPWDEITNLNADYLNNSGVLIFEYIRRILSQ